jgi:hypothetical protein
VGCATSKSPSLPSLVDIGIGAADLIIMEGRLGDLEVAQPTIALAEEALETAVSAAGYSTSV